MDEYLIYVVDYKRFQFEVVMDSGTLLALIDLSGLVLYNAIQGPVVVTKAECHDWIIWNAVCNKNHNLFSPKISSCALHISYFLG